MQISFGKIEDTYLPFINTRGPSLSFLSISYLDLILILFISLYPNSIHIKFGYNKNKIEIKPGQKDMDGT